MRDAGNDETVVRGEGASEGSEESPESSGSDRTKRFAKGSKDELAEIEPVLAGISRRFGQVREEGEREKPQLADVERVLEGTRKKRKRKPEDVDAALADLSGNG